MVNFTFPEPISSPINIVETPEFLTLEEIKQVSKLVKKLPLVDGTTSGEKPNNKVRSSKVKWIPHSQEWQWLYSKIYSEIHTINSFSWRFDLKSSVENIQFTEYSSDYKGKYDWHLDIGSTYPAAHRKVSLTIQLSDPKSYEGGNLQLFNTGQRNDEDPNLPYYLYNSPKGLGHATFFPSFLPHRVTTLTRGIRRSLVLWVGGSPLR